MYKYYLSICTKIIKAQVPTEWVKLSDKTH
jgi:hypothetical protein